jgi:hypothetical protein
VKQRRKIPQEEEEEEGQSQETGGHLARTGKFCIVKKSFILDSIQYGIYSNCCVKSS